MNSDFSSAKFDCRACFTAMLSAGMMVSLSADTLSAQGHTGEQIYRQQCASCHGATGEGTPENYARALAGDRSVVQLTRLISKTMPKDDPGTCTGEDARKVAQYIFDTFYSPAARARNKPPRIELSRLTVRQYRNAVTDLMASFSNSEHYTLADLIECLGTSPGRCTVTDFIDSFRIPGRQEQQHGLRGEYFRLRFQNSDWCFQRIDPEIGFDFKTSSPNSKKLKADHFSIRWRGSILAPETGNYEFIVHTKQPARLWINDFENPAIDAWITSKNQTEHRQSLYLLGGRAYPLCLEFSKTSSLGFANGLEESDSQKPTESSVFLEWKLPNRPAEVIPQRNLTPDCFPQVFVVTTPFPPDDRNAGYERGTSISKAWDEATTNAAIEVVTQIISHFQSFVGIRSDAPDARSRVRDFCLKFAERAFRQPLTEEQKRLYVDHQLEAARDLQTAVKRVILLVLKSPRFLYRELGGRESYDVASRLSFDLWDSLPDRELLRAAASDQLATHEQVLHQVERMVTDSRTRAKLHTFFLQWLKVEAVPNLNKDPKLFPGFDQQIASDLRTSLELFLDDVAWNEASDFRQLLLSDSVYLNGRLAKFYGVQLPANAPFQKVTWKKGEYAGVLSHPYLMSAFAYPTSSSPIHRGVFLTRNVLGRSLAPPPEAFTPLPAELHPQLTTRERVVLQTRPQACMACHAIINPLGFTMENFDAVGRFQDREKGRPIDASGDYQTRTGEVVKIGGIRDLARFLAQSEEAQEAFIEQLFHYMVKQPIQAFGPRKLTELRQSFARNGYSIRKLLVAIAAETALNTLKKTS